MHRSWSIGLVEEGGPRWRDEEAKGGGVEEEEVRLGKTSITRVGDGLGRELEGLTRAGDVKWGAKLKSRKV